MEIGVRAAGGAVHRDEIAERHAKETDAGQTRGSHREIVVLGIELDDHGFLQLEAVALRVLPGSFGSRGRAHTARARRPRPCAVAAVRRGFSPAGSGPAAACGRVAVEQMALDDEVVEAVDEPQRVHDRRAERIAAVGDLQVLAGLRRLVLAQQVHAELGMGGVEVRARCRRPSGRARSPRDSGA